MDWTKIWVGLFCRRHPTNPSSCETSERYAPITLKHSTTVSASRSVFWRRQLRNINFLHQMRSSKQIRHNTFPDVTLLSDVFDQGVPPEEVQAQQKSMPARPSRRGQSCSVAYRTVYYSGSSKTKALAASRRAANGRQNSRGRFLTNNRQCRSCSGNKPPRVAK